MFHQSAQRHVVVASDPLLQTAGLLTERLNAWKHAVVYIEEYMEAVEKLHKTQAKEYERVLKVLGPFLRSLGGDAAAYTILDHLQAS